jgi:hypothetical protein
MIRNRGVFSTIAYLTRRSLSLALGFYGAAISSFYHCRLPLSPSYTYIQVKSPYLECSNYDSTIHMDRQQGKMVHKELIIYKKRNPNSPKNAATVASRFPLKKGFKRGNR